MVFMLPHDGDHVKHMGDHRDHKIKLIGPVSNASEDRFLAVACCGANIPNRDGKWLSFFSKKSHRRVKSDLC